MSTATVLRPRAFPEAGTGCLLGALAAEGPACSTLGAGLWKGPGPPLRSHSDGVTLPAAAWAAEARRLERSLRDVTERWRREQRERRRLQEALAVGDRPPDPDHGAAWGREVTALHLGDLRAGQRAWVGVRFAEVETPKQDWSPVKPEPPLRRSQAQGAGPASSPALVHPARVCAEVTAGRGPGGMLWPPPRPGLFGP